MIFVDSNIPMYLVGASHPNKDAIQPAFEALKSVVDEVLPIDGADVDRAREILLGSDRISARDALHVAVMQRHGASTILSFDTGFEGIPGVRRIP